MSVMHDLLLIAVVSVVTAGIRFLPFVFFRDAKRTPKSLEYLSQVLPGAIIGMLVVYCFKSIDIVAWPFALPELIATAVVILLHIIKRNILLSIGVGTVLYMLLVQIIFV